MLFILWFLFVFVTILLQKLAKLFVESWLGEDRMIEDCSVWKTKTAVHKRSQASCPGNLSPDHKHTCSSINLIAVPNSGRSYLYICFFTTTKPWNNYEKVPGVIRFNILFLNGWFLIEKAVTNLHLSSDFNIGFRVQNSGRQPQAYWFFKILWGWISVLSLKVRFKRQ